LPIFDDVLDGAGEIAFHFVVQPALREPPTAYCLPPSACCLSPNAHYLMPLLILLATFHFRLSTFDFHLFTLNSRFLMLFRPKPLL